MFVCLSFSLALFEFTKHRIKIQCLSRRSKVDHPQLDEISLFVRYKILKFELWDSVHPSTLGPCPRHSRRDSPLWRFSRTSRGQTPFGSFCNLRPGPSFVPKMALILLLYLYFRRALCQNRSGWWFSERQSDIWDGLHSSKQIFSVWWRRIYSRNLTKWNERS